MRRRRGIPQEIISDRGTNFAGAARELQELESQLDQKKIPERTVDKKLSGSLTNRWLHILVEFTRL